jgi:hypothetical protein
MIIPGAQLCDVCSTQSSCQPSDSALHHILNHLVSPLSLSQPTLLGQMKWNKISMHLPPDPVHQPAPSAMFPIHLAVANAILAFRHARSTCAEELEHHVHVASDNLVKSCVNCWCNGFEYYSHSLVDCCWSPNELRNEVWKKWKSSLSLPIGCCFYCSCPQKVWSIK